MSLLLAKADAPEQGLYLDFHEDPEMNRELLGGALTYPVIILLALEKGTRVVFHEPGCGKETQYGDVRSGMENCRIQAKKRKGTKLLST